MALRFRKSVKVGPVRLTATRRGISTSVGAGPVRISRAADGTLRRTISAPGTGVYDTAVIGGQRGAQPAAGPAGGLVPVRWPAPAGPAATGWQRKLVAIRLRKAGMPVPDLSALTIGQAVDLLAQLRTDPADLWRAGRAWGSAGRATRQWRDEHR